MKHCLLLLLLGCSLSCFSLNKREMRGVWIATVANIDWPTYRDTTVEVQKMELIAILDSLHRNKINTVVFQVRPTSDALYSSPYEPWSEWLTGKQGKAPRTAFDPLQVVVEEAHKRCMEVHAWINPYRVSNTPKSVLSSDHLYYKKNYLFKTYGDKIFFDPGLDETADYLLTVLSDIVTRYDIDAIHLDDYFYPYPVGGKDFPDDSTFKANPRGFTNKGDWRRDNVNRIVSRIQDTVKSIKPWVEFGVSPFGVWRNLSNDSLGSATQAGVTNYDDLYADILLWVNNGWVDYITPQLYWEIGKKVADYEVLAPWWLTNTSKGKLYFGLYASGLEVNKPKAWKTPNELIRQMKYNEECTPIDGVMFYSTRYFLKNLQGLQDSLKKDFFRYPALTPELKGGEEAVAPTNFNKSDNILSWDAVNEQGGKSVSYYVVYAFPDSVSFDFENPKYIAGLTASNSFDLNRYPEYLKEKFTFAVTSVNRYRKESSPSNIIYAE